MPVTSSLVASPKRGAEVVFGIVLDPKDASPFVAGLVKATSRILQVVSAKARAFPAVRGSF